MNDVNMTGTVFCVDSRSRKAKVASMGNLNYVRKMSLKA